MKKKITIIVISILCLSIAMGITGAAIIASSNKKHAEAQDDIFIKLNAKYKKNKDAKKYTEIVAYINEKPVYMSEVTFYQEKAKIDFNEVMLSGVQDKDILEYAEKMSSLDSEETIFQIAMSRAMILKAEELGHSISHEEVREYQNEQLSKREFLSEEIGENAANKIHNDYKELYKKLFVTEEEYLETYDFLLKKAALAGLYAIDEYMTKYFERDFEKEEYNPAAAQLNYCEELGKQMNIRFVDAD